jgi:ABC-2 type transport system permease protein
VRLGPLLATLRRDFLTTASYRIAFVLDLVLGMLSIFIYYFINETFEGAPTEGLGGAPDFFSFAAVGAVITLVAQAASTGLTRKLREEQLTGTLEALATQPISAAEISLGLAGFPFMFATVRSLLYLGVAAIVLDLQLGSANWPAFLVMVLLSGLTLSIIGILVGALVLVINRGDVLAPLITTALGFVGGSVFPITVLPGWVEAVGRIVPTRFVFDGVRDTLFLGSGWEGDALVLVAYSLVGVPSAIWLFSLALATSKARGTLGQY